MQGWDKLVKKWGLGSHNGAFVGLDANVKGMIHVSDMFWTKTIRHPSEIVAQRNKINVVCHWKKKG